MNYENNYLADIKFIGFLYKKAFAASRFFWVFLLLNAISNAAAALLWVYVPKYIIDELTGTQKLNTVLSYILIFVLGQLILGIISHVTETKGSICNEKIDHYLRKELSMKIMKLDYERLEDPKTLDLKDRASEGINFWGGISGINHLLTEGISALLSIGTLVILIVQLNYIFAIALFVFAALKTLLSNKLRVIVMQFWDKLGIFNRQFRYLASLMTDYRYGKDVRLYKMSDLICEKSEAYREATLDYYVKQGNTERRFYYAQNLVSLLQDLTVYGFIAYYAYSGSLGIGSLVLYISAATSIIVNSTKIAGEIVELKRICQYGSPYKEFMQLPDAALRSGMPVPACREYSITLNNVSFKYPGSEHYVLKNVSFIINHQEKVSIVGLNGAGKTTLIKLLLRLYEPTEGEILINGVNVQRYDYEEYLNLFSVVFQDFRLLAASIRENITCTDADVPDAKIWEALEKVSLDEKCSSLPSKEKTQLFKNFYEDGIELSGGQNQKLAIARAIFKNAPFVFLDEPTSNLDPIAEYEIFTNFDSLVSHKTTVYISHRLSTCRLSDKIVVINNGSVAEIGTHEELVNKSGLYQEMWSAQAKYYVNT